MKKEAKRKAIIEILIHYRAIFRNGDLRKSHWQMLYEDLMALPDIDEDIDYLRCDKSCKWFKVGYGHCNWCICNAHDGLSDNYEFIEK